MIYDMQLVKLLICCKNPPHKNITVGVHKLSTVIRYKTKWAFKAE